MISPPYAATPCHADATVSAGASLRLRLYGSQRFFAWRHDTLMMLMRHDDAPCRALRYYRQPAIYDAAAATRLLLRYFMATRFAAPLILILMLSCARRVIR